MVELAIALSGACVAGIIWAVRLEGRVNTEVVERENLDKRQEDFKELVNTKLDLMNEAVCARLDRIERSMNGHLHHGRD